MEQATRPWLDDPMLAGLYDYWRGKRAGRAVPARADIDPAEISSRILPHVVLTELVEAAGRRRYRFRLSGTAIKEQVGLDLTGKFIDELNPNKKYAAYVEALYGTAIESSRPVYSTSMALGSRVNAYRTTQRLILPLSRAGNRVELFLCGQTFQSIGDGDAPTLTYADGFRPGPTVVIDPDE